MSAFLRALAITVGVTTAFASFATGAAGTPPHMQRRRQLSCRAPRRARRSPSRWS